MEQFHQDHISHPFGKPVNILKFGEDNKFIVDNDELNKIFLHDKVKNRKVVAISIIGAFRRGKSFFLDYCLRYLYATYPSISNQKGRIRKCVEVVKSLGFNKEWIGEAEEPLKGFSWRSGIKRDTTGIIMWSDVFLHTVEKTGEKIALVVIDTQGLFDNETSPADNSRIFALGTLISSVQILNLAGIIQEDQLQYLQFATEFAKFAAIDCQGQAQKPFQNLLFLIRDWNNPDEYSFGMNGGNRYLEEVLRINSKQKSELRSVRNFIWSSFERLECCLMPRPGDCVSLRKEYDGRWISMDADFRDELVNIIEKLLNPERLVLKKINGKDLKGSEFKEFVEWYFTLFQSELLPQPQSIYESLIDKQMNILIDKCMNLYTENIEKCQASSEDAYLQFFHELSEFKTLLMFKEEKKMGNAEHEKKFKAQLETRMEKIYGVVRDRSLKSIKQNKEEKEKLRLQQENREAERILKEKQAKSDLEQLKEERDTEKALRRKREKELKVKTKESDAKYNCSLM